MNLAEFQLYEALQQGHDSPPLLEMFAKPAWTLDALCREYPTDWWFPEVGETAEAARSICARCPVVDDCLAYALEHPERGIWGGTSQKERRTLRRSAA